MNETEKLQAEIIKIYEKLIINQKKQIDILNGIIEDQVEFVKNLI